MWNFLGRSRLQTFIDLFPLKLAASFYLIYGGFGARRAALIKMDGLAPEQTTSPRPPRRWGIERADQVPSSLESFTSNLGPASVGTVYPIYVHFRHPYRI